MGEGDIHLLHRWEEEEKLLLWFFNHSTKQQLILVEIVSVKKHWSSRWLCIWTASDTGGDLQVLQPPICSGLMFVSWTQEAFMLPPFLRCRLFSSSAALLRVNQVCWCYQKQSVTDWTVLGRPSVSVHIHRGGAAKTWNLEGIVTVHQHVLPRLFYCCHW